MASNQRQRRRSAGLQRLALFVFAGLLVLLFVGFAIAQGIGHPSVPSDAVAIVEDAPGDGTITDAEFQHALVLAAKASKVSPVPKPGDKQYEELKTKALGEKINAIWIEGQAEEMGISISPKEVANELEKLKKKTFKTEAQYQEFLKEAGFTKADVDERVKLQVLTEEIQTRITEGAPAPSDDEIREYYEAAKSSQFTQPETRDIRSVVNKDKGKAEEAKAKLEEDDSPANWGKVAKQYSTETATKATGGLTPGIAEGATPEPGNAAIYAAPVGQVEGPLKGPEGFIVFEVEKVTPEKVQSLEEAEPQIGAQRAEQLKQQAFVGFIRSFTGTWGSRTFCASDYLIERCANFKSDGRSPEANPACFEANPKGGPPEACPAPIAQVKPAQPGTVGLLAPEGQKLAQRPRPSKLAAAPEAVSPIGAPPVPGE